MISKLPSKKAPPKSASAPQSSAKGSKKRDRSGRHRRTRRRDQLCCARFAARKPHAIEGAHAGALKVRLTAPPLDWRANDALRRLLAGRLNVPMSAVRIVSGEKSRTKRVAAFGVSRAQVTTILD